MGTPQLYSRSFTVNLQVSPSLQEYSALPSRVLSSLSPSLCPFFSFSFVISFTMTFLRHSLCYNLSPSCPMIWHIYVMSFAMTVLRHPSPCPFFAIPVTIPIIISWLHSGLHAFYYVFRHVLRLVARQALPYLFSSLSPPNFFHHVFRGVLRPFLSCSSRRRPPPPLPPASA